MENPELAAFYLNFRPQQQHAADDKNPPITTHLKVCEARKVLKICNTNIKKEKAEEEKKKRRHTISYH
jgi:hypothetical protein